jgi:hypothetical protein
MEIFIFLLQAFSFVVTVIEVLEILAIIFLDLSPPNHKNPVSAVGGLPEADPPSRT